MEEWKIAIEDYEISNFGNCRRKMKNGEYKIIKGSLMSPSKNRVYKMRYFQLNRNGKRINYLFSHLVAKCFIGEKPDGCEIDHIDINPLNNNVLNLRYITHRENCLNQTRTIKDIPIDVIDRQKIVQQKYNDEHRNEILIRKKEYYIKNKEKMLEYQKNKKIDIECSKCKIIRNTSCTNYNHLKRNGLENNLCKRCSSIHNLPN